MATPLFIFEMANNHQGDVKHGLRIIDEMARIAQKYGIRASVKLQYRDLDSFIHPDYREHSDNKHIKRFLSTALSKHEYECLVGAIKDNGLTAICTPFDEASVLDLVNHGVDIIKVASCSANDWPLLEAIAATQKPVICSTGGLRNPEIDQVVTFFEHRQCSSLSLLHCVGLYPTANSAGNLNSLDWMRRRYHWLRIGYSGHEAPENYDVVKIAIAKGAQVLERHVGVPTDSIQLNAYSMSPEQTARWVESALVALEICGSEGEKPISLEERESLIALKRGAFARKPVAKGEAITPDNVFFAMPCQAGQTTSAEYQETMVASQDYPVNAPFTERRQPSMASTLRSLIHQAKGMLYEAKIATGREYRIEMSHHYGPENFRSWGALIVNLVNREYCKKLIIMLPGQRHPNHRHEKKEETFQLLHGDLDVQVNDQTRQLREGDLQLIRRGDWHRFSTVNGAIFEEISTTHIVGDSYYEDPRISKLDPIQRKTVLDMW